MSGKAGVYVRTQVSPTGMFQPQHYLPLTPLMDKVSEQSAEGSDAPKTHTRADTHWGRHSPASELQVKIPTLIWSWTQT